MVKRHLLRPEIKDGQIVLDQFFLKTFPLPGPTCGALFFIGHILSTQIIRTKDEGTKWRLAKMQAGGSHVLTVAILPRQYSNPGIKTLAKNISSTFTFTQSS